MSTKVDLEWVSFQRLNWIVFFTLLDGHIGTFANPQKIFTLVTEHEGTIKIHVVLFIYNYFFSDIFSWWFLALLLVRQRNLFSGHFESRFDSPNRKLEWRGFLQKGCKMKLFTSFFIITTLRHSQRLCPSTLSLCCCLYSRVPFFVNFFEWTQLRTTATFIKTLTSSKNI